MPVVALAFALTALILSILVPARAHAAAQPRLVVGFHAGTAPASQARVLRGATGRSFTARSVTKSGIPALRAVVVPVRRGELAATRKRLLARRDVAYVEIDHVARAYDADPVGSAPWRPNDTLLAEQWSLAAMNVPQAWSYARGAGVTVAVLDTGVDYVHPDLRGRVDLGRDFVDGDADPMDVQGHGTHVAGTVAAATDNGFGIAGIAPEARILAVRVLDADGQGNYSTVADGIVYAVDRGAKVLNLSLGGPEPSSLLKTAVDYAAARGVVVTCAAGNESAKQIGYPARYESCTAVGATDPADAHASFSNVGAGIDISAPGVEILSSTMGGSHEAWEGTSMASPAVAGVAALLRSHGLGRRAILDTISATSRDLGRPGPDTTFGAGRIDAGAALAAASRQARAGVDSTPPVVSSVRLLAPRDIVSKQSKVTWKVRSRTGWKRVGTTYEFGRFQWSQTTTRGKTRTVATYRADAGIVYRRTVTSVRVTKVIRRVTRMLRVEVAARDDVAVDRVAVEMDGRTAGVQWAPRAGSWVVAVACAPGRRTLVGRAFDAADNEASARAAATIRC